MEPNKQTQTPPTDQGPHDPDQENPPQEAHGGSMAPDLVDDTGHPKQETEENQP